MKKRSGTIKKSALLMLCFIVVSSVLAIEWPDQLSMIWRSKLKRLFPTTVCDRQYVYLMEWTLQKMASRINFDGVAMCKEYMILLKRHQDLTILIQYLERSVFDAVDLFELQKPIGQYLKCQARVGDDSHVQAQYLRVKARGFEQQAKFLETEFPASICDEQYQKILEAVFERISSRLDKEMRLLAREYMILVKHHNEIGDLISYLDRAVFGSTDLNELRKPLTQYFRCYRTLGTGVS